MVSFITFVLSLTWQDAVDVLLNSYILFRLYVLFRGTAVFRVFIGIALLVCAQRIAVFLGLVLTSWAIQGITAAATLIIIVVFRNEIRSVLQARNLKAILWGSPFKEIRTPVETIVDSVWELAQKQCGALFVFPGKDDIRDFLHSSTAVDCIISREMILSIFWRDNPVHDGALIVQDSRITRVGAVLPVSNREDLPSYYGTRHRAALGLAERCDALVLAVSEERGTITVAQNAGLATVSGREELTHLLRKHLLRQDERREYMVKEKRELTAAALAAFILVTIIWFGFTRGADTFMAFDVPLEYINRDPAVDIVDADAASVKLQVSGSGTLIKSLQPGQVHVRIDLGKASLGRNSFALTSEQIQVPPGVLIKKVEPSSITVMLDAVLQKQLPVQVDWVGKLPDTVLITGCDVDPGTVTLEGARQVLGRMTTLYTEKVPVDELTGSDTMTVRVVLNPPSLRIIAGSETVTVRYSVKERAPRTEP
jgi:uncharacterized protein (TIGR00159 family)